MTIDCRFATIDDWPRLRDFYRAIYRDGHPLHNAAFWRWQYAHPEHGQAAIALDGDRVVAHLGALFAGGFSWIINVHVVADYRGRGLPDRLHALAAHVAPNAATNSNRAALDMHRAMGFTRYADLQRYTAIAPGIERARAVAPAQLARGSQPNGHHYWSQPGLLGTTLSDGSTAVLQPQAGGVRIVHIGDPARVLDACWQVGARWADFITSWNDPRCRNLDRKHGWELGDGVPWQVNPLVAGSRSQITVTSKLPLPPQLIIDRTFSDHGRVGSLPASE